MNQYFFNFSAGKKKTATDFTVRISYYGFMEHFLPLFITLLIGLLFSVGFKKVQIPWVVTLIFAGIAVGPHGLDWLQLDKTIEFMSQSGLVLMMFMAGLESQLSSFKEFQNKMLLLSFINGSVPFIVGFSLAYFLGYGVVTSLLVGIIFISSSVAVVIPSLEGTKLINTPLGSAVLSTSIVQDVASLVLLSFFLQTEQNLAQLPLYIFYPAVIVVIILIRIMVPKVQHFVFKNAVDEEDAFQKDLRFILLILFGIVIIFELLGLHAIVAGFFAGLVLSESLKSEVILGKIRAISYGIFVPIFFIVVGMQTDIQLLLTAQNFAVLTTIIVVGSVLSKLISGTIGARLVGFNTSQSVFFGVSSVPQLSTTLAAAFTGQ